MGFKKFIKKDVQTKRENLYVDCFVKGLGACIIFGLICFVAYAVACKLLTKFGVLNANWFSISYFHGVTLIALLSLAVAAISVYVTIKVNETVNYHSFNTQYGGNDMLSAIRAVGDVGRRWTAYFCGSPDGAGFIAPYVFTRNEDYNPNDRLIIKNIKSFVVDNNRYMPWSEEEDRARRMLKNHFSQALELYRTRRIGKSVFRNICDNDSLRLLFEVVEPMEAIMNEEYHFNVFYEIMEAMKDECPRLRDITKAHDYTRYYWDVPKEKGAEPPQKSWVKRNAPCVNANPNNTAGQEASQENNLKK
ncbi:MAG: hypothetical protein IKO64_06210 [Kiritimatiellae bacterium]|nr:hypothetical protein [Kiritimatiellia bacterium]